MKRVTLIRHGESAAQGFKRRERWNPSSHHLRDVALAPAGELQAANLRLDGEPPELVVCSPLTRAVQTALLAFGTSKVPIVAHPCLREAAPRAYGAVGSPQQPECRGRPVNELVADGRLPEVARVDWSLMPPGSEPWWSEVVESEEEFEQRLSSFSAWLSDRPETSFAVVCHFYVIQTLLKVKGLKVQNCLPIACEVSSGSWNILACADESTRLPKSEASSREADSERALLDSERTSSQGVVKG
eukprot:TRINITY_DN10414_c0_g1_i2.p1 TRINITY_DN10414_c0_g1~~TRINITY_DN10414_c0_g1_i2.p1  ORF type:complete len:244 (+),score=46.74 TRINITY_DN10414_c0_g1_i2:60-791(+)